MLSIYRDSLLVTIVVDRVKPPSGVWRERTFKLGVSAKPWCGRERCSVWPSLGAVQWCSAVLCNATT